MTEPQKIPFLNKKLDAAGNVAPTTHADLPAAPGIANPEPNHFKVFWEKIGHKIASVITWAPSFASKVIKVVNSAEIMTPEFDAGLHLIIKDVSVIVANAALAAAQKGLNPANDYETLVALETLVKDFNVFWPVVAKEFDTLEGIFHEPGVPVPPSEFLNTLEKATAPEVVVTEPVVEVPATPVFTPKVPVE